LGKGHAKELIQARKAYDLVLPFVALDALLKIVPRQKIHELGKDRVPCIHEPSPSAMMKKYGSFAALYRKKTFYGSTSMNLSSYRTFST
jgi:hypothetical protein